MTRTAGIIAAALFLVLAGTVLLMAGRFDRRMAIAEEDMAVLEFVDPQLEYARLEEDLTGIPFVSERVRGEIRRRRATLQYWQGDYDELVEMARTASPDDRDADPELRVLAANALYRIAESGPQDRPTLLKNLDAAIRAYHEALRTGVVRPDVAYNYELAIRMRAEVGGGKRKSMQPATIKDPLNMNLHGEAGEPPPDLKAEEFKVRVPMEPRELKKGEDEAAGTGAQRRRRG